MAIALGVSLAAGSAEAAISYSFYDQGELVLSFETETLISLDSNNLAVSNLGGLHGDLFVGGILEYRQGPAGFQPVYAIDVRPEDGVLYRFRATFSAPDFPHGDDENGVPSPRLGPYTLAPGQIVTFDFDAGVSSLLAFPDAAVIAEVPTIDVAEPASLALLGVGLLGLAALRRRNES